jgi:hypothetical protein
LLYKFNNNSCYFLVIIGLDDGFKEEKAPEFLLRQSPKTNQKSNQIVSLLPLMDRGV